MTDEMAIEIGKPGEPGEVRVFYLRDLKRGDLIPCEVGSAGSPGKGGTAKLPSNIPSNSIQIAGLPNPGGAGGGWENTPVIEALKFYADSLAGEYLKPIYFLEPGSYQVYWPYDTATATLVVIGGGGGGGGGAATVTQQGDSYVVRNGNDGDQGLPGAVFVFPTDVPTQDANNRI